MLIVVIVMIVVVVVAVASLTTFHRTTEVSFDPAVIRIMVIIVVPFVALFVLVI
ncbi:MAG: hypothetical protein ACI35J_03410 [Peribacillus sp.]